MKTQNSNYSFYNGIETGKKKSINGSETTEKGIVGSEQKIYNSNGTWFPIILGNSKFYIYATIEKEKVENTKQQII